MTGPVGHKLLRENPDSGGRLGAILRVFLPYGQNSAGIPDGNNHVLAGKIVPCKVAGLCGSVLPASHVHLLFRTPSFRGQACVPHVVLPAFFFAPDIGEKRQKPAHNAVGLHGFLRIGASCVHLVPKQLKNSKGQKTCNSHELSLHWRPVQALQPAVTQPASRHCLAVAQARSAPRFSARTRYSAPLWARQATSCTARRRAPVTNPDFSGRTLPQSLLRKAPFRGCRPVTAFLRFPSFKTKDVACSTRS